MGQVDKEEAHVPELVEHQGVGFRFEGLVFRVPGLIGFRV
jgi:hypothetical protein